MVPRSRPGSPALRRLDRMSMGLCGVRRARRYLDLGFGRIVPLGAIEGPAESDAVLRFPVVGIGASAGGLEAIRRLLQSLPDEIGMAFVLVQHLHPEHPSALSEILSRVTRMPVTEVTDEPELVPDRVYVIPPGRVMTVSKGHLQVFPRESPGPSHPIDLFFRSLAEERKSGAIGVLLSGTGSDGTIGLAEIKGAGGVTFAQDASARHDTMPRNAIAAGCVDFVLPPERIAEELARIARHPFVRSPEEAAQQLLVADESGMMSILRHLRDANDVDFSFYKSATLTRRIRRRMLLHGLENLEQYARLLEERPEEVGRSTRTC
jgi:two-component system CheB/CheR fusion protein